MSGIINLNGSSDGIARLYDPSGHVLTEWHPGFEARKRAIMFGAGGYNPDQSARGGTGGMYANAGRENFASNRDRLKMMWDARDLVKYDWIGGVMGRIILYVAGKIDAKSATGDPQVNEMYDEYFHNWCGDEVDDERGITVCDLSGRHRFSKMAQMALMGFLVDGDSGILEIAPQESPSAEMEWSGEYVPGSGRYCLQLITADRIGSPLESTTFEDYIGGIKLDPQTGQIDFYRIFERTRSNMYLNPQERSPADFIHVFDPDFPDEYRGRTKLLRLLNDCRDIREWIEAEKRAGKIQSQYAAMIGTKDVYSGTGAGAWSGTNDAGTPTQEAVWGKILKMAEGESFSMLSPSARPSGAFMAFIDTLIRKMAQSLGLSYGFLWNLATLGGVSQRIELQSDLRRIQYWQDNILTNKILNRIRRKVIAEGISLGLLPPHPNWKKCDWHFGPWITTDAGYEMQNDIAATIHGIVPIAEITHKYGRSPREVFRSNAGTANEAIEVGAEAALPVEAFAKGLYPDITAQRAAFLTPTPQPPPPPLSIDAITDKGLKIVTEIIEQVGDGTIDRESAIELLIRAFPGTTRQDAEKVVPDEPSEADLNRAAGLDAQGRHAPAAAPASGKQVSSNKNPKKATANAT